ncbi:hypothetical protein HDU81_010976, partial [Chytriomyces hyalinus]
MEIQDPLLMQLVAEPLLLDLHQIKEQQQQQQPDFFYSGGGTPVTPYLTSPAPSVSSNMSSYTQQQEYSKSAPQQQYQQRSGLEWLPTANSAYLHVSNWGSSMTSSNQMSSTRKDGPTAKSGDFKSNGSSKSLSSSPNQSTAEFGYRRKNSAPVSLDGAAGKKAVK